VNIIDILSPESIAFDTALSSKKAALEKLSALIASGDSGITHNEVFDSLISRERLGSTGLGQGIAIPHGRRKGGTKTLGAFLKLETGINYDAIDQKPVDLLFALIVPEQSTQEHLDILSKLAEMFSNTDLVNKLRNEPTPPSIYEILVGNTS